MVSGKGTYTAKALAYQGRLGPRHEHDMCLYAKFPRLHSLWTYLPYPLVKSVWQKLVRSPPLQITQSIGDDVQKLVLLIEAYAFLYAYC